MFGPLHEEKMILFHANITGTDQPAHPRILISVIVISFDMLREKVNILVFSVGRMPPTFPLQKRFSFSHGAMDCPVIEEILVIITPFFVKVLSSNHIAWEKGTGCFVF